MGGPSLGHGQITNMNNIDRGSEVPFRTAGRGGNRWSYMPDVSSPAPDGCQMVDHSTDKRPSSGCWQWKWLLALKAERGWSGRGWRRRISAAAAAAAAAVSAAPTERTLGPSNKPKAAHKVKLYGAVAGSG